MTKRDVERITIELRSVRPHVNALISYDQWWIDVRAMCRVLRDTYKKFNEEEFLINCGVPPVS